MYECIVFFIAPLSSFLIYEYANGKDSVECEKFRFWANSALCRAIFFLIIDNIIMLIIYSMFLNGGNLIDAMKNSIKYTLVVLTISTIVGLCIGFITYAYCNRGVQIEVGEWSGRISLKKIGNWIAFLIPLCSIVISLLQCIDNNFWADEAYTILNVNEANSFYEVIHADPDNPPLYYLIFKILTLLFGEIYWVYHLVSVIPVVLLLIFSCTYLRKEFGVTTSIIFSLFFLMTQEARTYSVEARAYSWAGFFVVFCFFEGYMLIKTYGQKTIHYILFGVAGVCAAYTQYFAFAGIALFYFMIFLRLVMHNKNNVKKCLCVLIFSIIAYIPWICVFLDAVKQKQGGFWITDTVSIYDGFLYIMGSEIMLYVYFLVAVSVLLYVYKVVTVRASKKDNKIQFGILIGNDGPDSIAWMVLTGFVTAMVIFVFEIVYGKAFSPIFVTRHIYPVAIAIWLSFSMCFSLLTKENIRQWTAALVIVIMLIAYENGFKIQLTSYFSENVMTHETIELVSEYTKYTDTYILTDNDHYAWTVMKYYFPNNTCKLINESTIYDFENDGIKTVLLFMEEPLDEKLLSTYEKNIGASLEFMNESCFAEYEYYLYKASFD